MEVDPYVLMGEEAEKAQPGCEGLIYLPYLMGERTPHLDPYGKGVFFGISARHNKRDMLRSVMEGVGYSLKDGLEIIKEMDIDAKEVRASGGGGKSPLWRQIQADLYNCEVITTNSTEGPALGVAILAGVYPSVAAACERVIKTVTSQKPINQNIELYNKYYEVYKKLYPALKDQFKVVAEIISK